MEVLPLEPEGCRTQQVRQLCTLQNRVSAPSDFTVCCSAGAFASSASMALVPWLCYRQTHATVHRNKSVSAEPIKN